MLPVVNHSFVSSRNFLPFIGFIFSSFDNFANLSALAPETTTVCFVCFLTIFLPLIIPPSSLNSEKILPWQPIISKSRLIFCAKSLELVVNLICGWFDFNKISPSVANKPSKIPTASSTLVICSMSNVF